MQFAQHEFRIPVSAVLVASRSRLCPSKEHRDHDRRDVDNRYTLSFLAGARLVARYLSERHLGVHHLEFFQRELVGAKDSIRKSLKEHDPDLSDSHTKKCSSCDEKCRAKHQDLWPGSVGNSMPA